MKKNTWNVRRLVDESFVPSAQGARIVDCWISVLASGKAHYKSQFIFRCKISSIKENRFFMSIINCISLERKGIKPVNVNYH